MRSCPRRWFCTFFMSFWIFFFYWNVDMLTNQRNGQWVGKNVKNFSFINHAVNAQKDREFRWMGFWGMGDTMSGDRKSKPKCNDSWPNVFGSIIPLLIQNVVKEPKNRWPWPFEDAMDPKCSLAFIYAPRVFIVCIFFCPDTFLRSFPPFDANESFRCKRKSLFWAGPGLYFFSFLGWANIYPDHPLYWPRKWNTIRKCCARLFRL